MDVNLLKLKLNSEKTEERLSGLREAIAESEALAVYVIKDYIKNEKNETILSAMLIACSKIGGSGEIDFIGSFLGHENFRIQKYAFQSLLLIDSPAVRPYIIRTMTEKDSRLKQMAVRAIRDLGKKKCLETIESMLISEIEWQRTSALEVLEMLNNILYENELVDILTRAIASSKKDFCAESVQKLKKIYDTGSEYAVDSVKKLLDSPGSEDLKKIILQAMPAAAAVKEESAAAVTTAKPAANAVEEKTVSQTAASGEKEEEVINDFANYIDKVVKSRPGKKAVVSPAAFEDKAFYVLWLINVTLFFRWLALFPFKLIYSHKYKFGALALSALMFYLYVCPEIMLGKGSFSDLKPVSRQSLSEYLASQGYELNRDPSGDILAFSHDHWIDSIWGAESYLGSSIIFSAYEINLKNSEIFEGTAYFDKYGAVGSVSGIKNLTETSMADEEELVVLANSFAYLSSARDGLKILTIQEGDYSNKRQFLFKQNVDISSITNSALAVNLLKVETKKGENLRNVSLNVDSGNIDPPDFPVEYIPNIEADEPFVPRLVEKVRNLGFVGPEKIARLEDFYYNTADYFKRKFYSGYEEEEDSARITRGREDDGEVETAAAAAPESSEIKIAAGSAAVNTAEANTAAVGLGNAPKEIAVSTENGKVFYQNLKNASLAAFREMTGADSALSTAVFLKESFGGALNSDALMTAFLKGTPDASVINAIADQNAASDQNASTVETAVSGIFPANIEPLLKKNGMKDEGVWSSAEVAFTDETPVAFKTKLRVDSKRSFAVMHFFCIDISKIDLRLVPGTNEPVSSIGLKGKGVIPNDESTYQSLICAFNGGFRTKHGQWGFIADGVSYMPPAKGIATVMVDAQGAIKMGTWGSAGFDTVENIMHLRQNLPPILESNVVNMKHDYWGASIDNKTRVWRSALGISRDGKWLIYGAGNSLGHDTLAAGMSLAGCDYAMQLDINDYHTYLYTYKQNGTDKKGNLKLKASMLSDGMSGETKRCLEPYTRDFFYVTLKQPEIKTASSR